MEKYREMAFKNSYVKYYRYGGILSPVPFLEELVSKGWKFDKVFMERDAEMDMQIGIGAYTLAQLQQSQGEPDYGPVRMYTVQAFLDGHCAEIHFSEDSDIVYIVTNEQNFELE